MSSFLGNNSIVGKTAKIEEKKEEEIILMIKDEESPRESSGSANPIGGKHSAELTEAQKEAEKDKASNVLDEIE